MKKIIMFFISVILVTGCGVSVDTVKMDYTARSAKSIHEVRILTEVPSRKYRVIAIIQVGPDALVADYNGQTRELVKRAAEMGGEAVIVEYNSRSSGYVVQGTGAVAQSKFTRGKVIVWE